MAIRKPAFSTQILLLALSACLALPILAVSSHVLSVYRHEHATNPWWLPIWHAHFDTRGLVGAISGSCIVFAFDIIAIGLAAALKKGQKSKALSWAMVALLLVSATASLVALIMPAVANATSPSKSDTVQTWTCRWKAAAGSPENFVPLCRQSTFSSYAPIPLFVIHVLLLAQSVQDAIAASKHPKPTFDEELVRITKSVEVATLGSQSSPRPEKGAERQ